MKKIVQQIFCYTTRTVIDVETKNTEVATYIMLFGFVIKTIYRPT